MRKKLRAALLEQQLTQDRDFREQVQVVAPQGFEGEMDVAIMNGQVNGFVQAWSFDVQDTEQLRDEVRGWGYLLQKVRSGRSIIDFGSTKVPVANDVAVDALYVPPKVSGHVAYADALRVFDDLGVTSRPLAQAQELAAHARGLLHRK